MVLSSFASIIIGVVSAFAAKEEAMKSPQSAILKSYLEKTGDDSVVEKLDSENKGKPDMFMLFRTTDSKERVLVRQLFDFDRDGKIDLVNHFQKGRKIRTETDLDFDGKADSISEFDPETGELAKRAMIENGSVTWKFWFKGDLRRKEVDRNGDGLPDMWVHYRNGKVIKTEIDTGFDGKNIRLESDLTKGQKQ